MFLPALLPLALAAGAAAPSAPAPSGAQQRFEALVRELERDRAEPRALVVLSRIRGLEEELPDLPQAAAVYSRIANDGESNAPKGEARRAAGQVHPEVRAWARVALAGVYRARGSLQKAEAELAKLAFVEDLQVIGPFDNEGRRGFDAVYPPEQEQDLSARYPGKIREVGWRPLPPEASRGGQSALDAPLGTSRDAVVYALAVLEAPREQRARIYLGASGAVKLWVNGQLAIADGGYHQVRLDQLAVEVPLRKGPNRLLVKLCQEEGRMGLILRLANAAGEPLRLRSVAAPLPPAQPPAAGKIEPVPSLVSLLEQRVKRAARARGERARLAEAEARFDLAAALADKRSAEERQRRAAEEARAAARLAPRWVDAQLLAARLEPDGNRSRAYLEAALAVEPESSRALYALGLHHLNRGRAHRAIGPLERAVKSGEGAAPRLALADAWETAGNAARGRRLRAEAARDFPTLAAPLVALARSERALDRRGEAARLLRKALALRWDESDARAALVQLLVDGGDLDGALLLLDEALRLAPADLSARLRKADLLAANGRADEAEAAFATAERIYPMEAEVKERRGRARLRSGRSDGAIADFQAALELAPQNAALKELLRAVQPERERYERPYLLDARELAKAPLGSKQGGGEAEDAVVLGEMKVSKVYPSGMASRFQQLVVRVLTARGAEAFRRHTFGYVPGRQELRVERARIVKPDGAVIEGAQEEDRSASEPWYRIWYDTRARTASFPQLAAGDLLEIAVRLDDVAGENLLSDYFGEVAFIADQTRKLRWEYVLLMPPGRPIYSGDAPAGVTGARRELEGGTEYRWSARDVARLREEPGMPGASEVVPFVHVSTYASWDEVGRFWWGLVREQLRPDGEVRATAESIAREVKAARRARGEPEAGDERALVEAVHGFVVTSTRYVGLEFGIHGYKPYRVDEVLARRFGDCKDKASLTAAMLSALGIDARLVLLRMKRLGTMPAKPASLSIFNHAITYVPRYELWLDGTAAFHGTRELPDEDREATVLVVSPDGSSRFQRTPPARAEDNATESGMDVTLAADGGAALDGWSRISGAAAPGYRRAYQSENDRRQVLEQAFSRTFPGLTVRTFQVSDLSRLEDPVEIRYQLTQPRFAERSADSLSFLPFGAAQGYAERYAPVSSRVHDLSMGEPHVNHFTYRVRLPADFQAPELPPPTRGETPFLAFELTHRVEGGVLVAEGRITFRQARVPAGDYPALREVLLQLDRALSRRVVLRRTQQAQSTTTPRSAP